VNGLTREKIEFLRSLPRPVADPWVDGMQMLLDAGMIDTEHRDHYGVTPPEPLYVRTPAADLLIECLDDLGL
jgi:hypothetical protein